MHCSIIFRKPETLRAEMKNVACLRLGKMLHPEIQKGKEAMKTSIFQKDLGGTTVYMKRLVVANKGCGQLKSNETYFDDSCFSSIKNAKEIADAGVNYFGPVKMNHKFFEVHSWPLGTRKTLGGS